MNNKVKFCIAIIVVIVMIVICVNILKKKNNTNEVNSNVVENITNNEEIELDGTNIEISAIPEDTNKLNLGVYVKVPGRPSVATRTVSLNKDYDFTNDYSGAVLQAKIY